MPFLLQWAVSQILSYDPVSWAAFIGIAAGAAYLGRWRGVIAGHFAVAFLVCMLDIDYQSQHSAQMDMDGIFAVGMIDRMLLINTMLLPISAIALWFIRRRQLARSAI